MSQGSRGLACQGLAPRQGRRKEHAAWGSVGLSSPAGQLGAGASEHFFPSLRVASAPPSNFWKLVAHWSAQVGPHELGRMQTKESGSGKGPLMTMVAIWLKIAKQHT